MPASSSLLAPTNVSDATFRAWGSFISACLAAAGWVKTADSGQIDWTTVTKPTMTDESRGYEIWRMDDALQATAPIFLRLEYGSGPGDQKDPGIWHRFGAGSDGAGAITGLTSSRVQSACQQNSATTYLWIVSADVNRLVFASCVDAANYQLGMYLMAERTKDGSGLDNGDGLLLAYTGAPSGGQTHAQKYWPHGGTTPGGEASLGIVMPTFGTGTDGVTTAVYPLMLSKGPFLNPPMGLLGCFLSNFTPSSPVPLSVYGALHTYMPCSSTFQLVARNATANPTTLLVRYE